VKLRVLREERGLTQKKEAAELANVSHWTLYHLESGKRPPYMPTVTKIARAYGVPVEELVEEESMHDDFDARAWRLLQAIYDLAGGNPGKLVSAKKAAERANIPHTTEDYDPVARHLRDSGQITVQGEYPEAINITPAGVSTVGREEGDHPPDPI
jgi:DNA-binding XRE family transcriptional regulator